MPSKDAAFGREPETRLIIYQRKSVDAEETDTWSVFMGAVQGAEQTVHSQAVVQPHAATSADLQRRYLAVSVI